MTSATFGNIFNLYYTLYRAEATVPTSADDEWQIALRFANEAVARWANYDNTYWRQLFDTNLNDGGGDSKIKAGTRTYFAPENMKEVGGYVTIHDAKTNSTLKRYPVIQPHEAQFRGDQSTYCYFVGDPNNGFTLYLNPVPDTSLNGQLIDYVYYKKPTEFINRDDITELADAEFICHRMLAMRFRASRNPYYGSALSDSEDALKIMKMANDSGSWANPWQVADNSGTQFGVERGGGFF